MHFINWSLLILSPLLSLRPAAAQSPSGNRYGGAASGVHITLPANAGGVSVVVQRPVLPGGRGTKPDNSSQELGGWNGAVAALSGANPSSSPEASARAFAKLQTVRVDLLQPAPPEHHWETQATAAVGGSVSAHLQDAHGSCHAAASSKTSVVYGPEQKAVASDRQAIALVHQGSALVGAELSILGCGAEFTTTYATAGTSASIQALADADTGNRCRGSSAVIDYVQKGDMAYTVQTAAGGGVAKAALEAKTLGSVDLHFFLVSGS